MALVLAGTAIVPITAYAQAAATVASSDPETVLEEVVVTAQKRSEKLVDVPITVSVTSEEGLERAAVASMEGLAHVVTGLRMDSGGAYSQPSIRGVSSAVAGPGLAANVATYVDGVYKPNPIGNDFDFADVESIQVLKGPQGTLFGRNATGGAILVTSKDPQFEPQGKLRLSYGRYNDFRAAAFVTAPISESFAGSVSVYGRKSDGFSRNINNGKREGDLETTAVRVKLLFQPTDQVYALIGVEHTHVIDPNPYFWNAYKGQSVGTLLGVPVATERGEVSGGDPALHKLKASQVYLRGGLDLGWADLTSYTSYQRSVADPEGFDIDGTIAPIITGYFPQYEDTITQEFNLNSVAGGRFDLVAGLFFMNQRARNTFDAMFGGPLINILYAGQTTDAYAAFFDATYEVVDNLFLTAGARYSIDKLEAYFGTPNTARDGASHTFYGFDPRFVVRYEISPDSNVYASVSRGSKSGAFNANGFSKVPVRPEKITAYELGYKTSQSGWRAEAAAFLYKYRDLQVNAYEGFTISLLNAARAESYGAEMHFAADLSEELSLDIGAAYTRSRYESFDDAPHYVYSPASGVTILPTDASGNQMQRSPELMANVGLVYQTQIRGGSLEASANYSYQSRVYFDAFEDVNQPAYGLLNVRAAWTDPSGQRTFAVYGRNVTDEAYINAVLQQPTAIFQRYAWPATYGVELTLAY